MQSSSTPLALLRTVSVLWFAAVVPLSALLLIVAVTFQGRLFAVGAISLGMVPLLAWMNPDIKWLRRAALALLLVWMGVAIWLVRVSPSGKPPTGARVENRYVGGKWNYQTQALGALLPEVDQFMLGFRLMPFLDPLFTQRQAGPLIKDTREIYQELEADSDSYALGSVMPDAYNEIWGLPFDRGHYFLYVPRSLDRTKPAPALVFLHGSGGSFKSYTWLLSKIADEQGVVIIAPSCGLGNWKAPRAPQMVVEALDDAAKVVALDMGRIHLAGLSNGGLGVTRTLVSPYANRFRSVILFSPVCDDKAVNSAPFAESCRGKPVLVISGEEDDRVPITYVRQCMDVMRRAGVEVQLSAYPQANHFLMFSHREQWREEISAWLKGK
ncbi:prolyl oligopeptidase family serine peptidase [Roseimicrobium sp. ORNL1]|uniref:prolyl oligopeptidase family serine peptidase n=1 Tax=Roseimicrobium sp. ORNL1 TaxID=2711231 RepID=UPI0013E1F611|nr:prolyl oligopeptidase family serine peptidase [Roseimicrobium sp. ORNL1]QIF04342.1 prolyl oligopeptidase family serine peptidase [Roseimicrobium sp. ORNL1]